MGASGCTCLEGELPTTEEGGGGTGGTGGTGGGQLLPCGVDCSMLPTPPCTVGVCNLGQEIGPVNNCVVIAAPTGTACDDGVFCTSGDTCDTGACVGGPSNDCGLPHTPCEAVICSEASQACNVAPVNDGTPCTPTDLCKINGLCEVGECIGEIKKCTLSPLQECNSVACESATGQCIGTPDPFKDNNPCVLTGDICQIDKACQAGQCVGGTPKDCSALDVTCEIGACDQSTGICTPMVAPEGSSCGEGLNDCEVGTCDSSGECKASAAPNGTTCNDHDSCTASDLCVGGACASGNAVGGCSVYLKEGFEVCPNGWTLAGDWECGVPINVGPPAAHTGNGVLATNIEGVYSSSQSFTTAVANSPPIDLTLATNPMLSFWAWDHTEGGTFDGWNLKVSSNGGMTYTPVATVTPPYPLTIQSQPSWGGNNSGAGWRNYQADLTAFAGQSIIIRFAFRSDAATVYAGVYIDDLYVAEPLQNPLFITKTSIADVYNGMALSETITRNGGSAGAVWSIVPGGTNTAWLTIDPMTGLLSGTPAATDVGPVSVTVRVEEPTLPSNFDQKTFTSQVSYAAYYTSFEGACPAGWTLSGTNWQCGAPTLVGPAAAFAGTQCLGTRIAGNYLNSQSYGTSTATSPDIDLSGSAFPTLTFRMWIDTEGGTKDGVNLKISNDGGMTYVLVDTVIPAYPLTIAAQPAWGGFQEGLGWQLMQANLAGYSGQVVNLRLSFRSDASANFPGIYVDDFLVQ